MLPRSDIPESFSIAILALGLIEHEIELETGATFQAAQKATRVLQGFKDFKLAAEDWRNRKRWAGYEAAVADMIDRTSTEIAPWAIVEAEDKHYARVKILRTLVCTLGEAL